MPATCVPWPDDVSVSARPSTKSDFVAGFPAVVNTSSWLKTIFTSWTVLEPKARSGCVPSIPESRIATPMPFPVMRSEEHTSELQSRLHLVCRLLLEKKKQKQQTTPHSQTTA